MRRFSAVLTFLLAGTASFSAFLGTPVRVTTPPVPIDSSRVGWITAQVEADACRQPAAACTGFPPGPALPGNATPVRLVLQLHALRALDPFERDAFEVLTQFAPPGASPLDAATCSECFEARPGDTYTLWLTPAGGSWKAGDYYLRAGIPGLPGIAPALVQLEIGGASPRPPNRPPIAVLSATPPDEQAVQQPVIFDGGHSSDPDSGDFITMYKWLVVSTNPDPGAPNPILVEGPAAASISFPSDWLGAFRNVQQLVVTLLVTDDPDAPQLFAAGTPVSYRAQASIPYAIVSVNCSANAAPTAVLSGPPTQNVVGVPLSLAPFSLDGSLSSDPETSIDAYNFSCGNGTTPIPSSAPSKVTCRYLVDNVPRSYTATLVVTDRGTGRLVNGQYECAKTSALASIQVVVSPTTSP